MSYTPSSLFALSLLVIWPALANSLETLPVTSTTVPVYFDLAATLEAVNQSTVSAQTSGAITEIFVDVNDAVLAGTLLLRIDDTQQQAALEQAKAALAQAQAQQTDAQLLLERNGRLHRQGSLSQGELDSTKARAQSANAAVKAAQAGLKQAQEQLTYTQVKAPYGGIVTARHVQLGELVSPGQPLLTGMAAEPLRAVADLPQRLIQDMQPDKITVFINNQAWQPENVVLFPYADPTLHSVRLRAELPKGQAFYAGQWAKMRVQTGERQTLMVPASAVLQRSELSSVYVLKNGQPRLRQVRTGVHEHHQIEILAGLSAGESIVSDALAQLALLTKEN